MASREAYSARSSRSSRRRFAGKSIMEEASARSVLAGSLGTPPRNTAETTYLYLLNWLVLSDKCNNRNF